ncbi:hypothetical protein CSKR_113889 [Clonorchis sinensis]|uniref:Uncharacterized protein n=1 Tax=Clonorchis sinensis TaxID=79923 RepID=A0A3R7D6U5_CLOSI|nr:hypothetical protein CSKR_113889 [Clonorchis sinensis]
MKPKTAFVQHIKFNCGIEGRFWLIHYISRIFSSPQFLTRCEPVEPSDGLSTLAGLCVCFVLLRLVSMSVVRRQLVIHLLEHQASGFFFLTCTPLSQKLCQSVRTSLKQEETNRWMHTFCSFLSMPA